MPTRSGSSRRCKGPGILDFFTFCESYSGGMNNRRNFFSFATGLLFAFGAEARTQARGSVKELARHALTGREEGMEVILVEVTAMPGASTVHRHPGFVLGYVLDGELKFAIDDGTPETVKAGGTFFEPHGALHTTGASAKPHQPVRFLAFIVAPKGSPVVLPT
jgi:quercetin dioxygenase-like cupin family protein